MRPSANATNVNKVEEYRLKIMIILIRDLIHEKVDGHEWKCSLRTVYVEMVFIDDEILIETHCTFHLAYFSAFVISNSVIKITSSP